MASASNISSQPVVSQPIKPEEAQGTLGEKPVTEETFSLSSSLVKIAKIALLVIGALALLGGMALILLAATAAVGPVGALFLGGFAASFILTGLGSLALAVSLDTIVAKVSEYLKKAKESARESLKEGSESLITTFRGEVDKVAKEGSLALKQGVETIKNDLSVEVDKGIKEALKQGSESIRDGLRSSEVQDDLKQGVHSIKTAILAETNNVVPEIAKHLSETLKIALRQELANITQPTVQAPAQAASANSSPPPSSSTPPPSTQTVENPAFPLGALGPLSQALGAAGTTPLFAHLLNGRLPKTT